MAQLSIRFDEDIRKQILELIDQGDFSTISEFVKYAVRKTLKDYSGRISHPPPPIKGDRGRGGLPDHSNLLRATTPTIARMSPAVIRIGMTPSRS